MPLVALFFRGMDVEEDRTTICKSAKNKTWGFLQLTRIAHKGLFLQQANIEIGIFLALVLHLSFVYFPAKTKVLRITTFRNFWLDAVYFKTNFLTWQGSFCYKTKKTLFWTSDLLEYCWKCISFWYEYRNTFATFLKYESNFQNIDWFFSLWQQ